MATIEELKAEIAGKVDDLVAAVHELYEDLTAPGSVTAAESPVPTTETQAPVQAPSGVNVNQQNVVEPAPVEESPTGAEGGSSTASSEPSSSTDAPSSAATGAAAPETALAPPVVPTEPDTTGL